MMAFHLYSLFLLSHWKGHFGSLCCIYKTKMICQTTQHEGKFKKKNFKPSMDRSSPLNSSFGLLFHCSLDFRSQEESLCYLSYLLVVFNPTFIIGGKPISLIILKFKGLSLR